MLHKILSSKNTHPKVIVSAKESIESRSYSDQNHFLVADWHMALQDLKKYSISIPEDSRLASVIRSSGFFAVNFVNADEFNKIVPDLKSEKSEINHFNLQVYESEKIKSPLLNNSIASIQCQLEKEMASAGNIVFTGRIIDSVFGRKD